MINIKHHHIDFLLQQGESEVQGKRQISSLYDW